MSEHTPGPWTVEHDEATKVLDADGCTLAWVGHLHLRGRRSSEEVGANARLIAAAVDMLEALEAIVADAEYLALVGDNHARRMAAKAAIAKAKGEAE